MEKAILDLKKKKKHITNKKERAILSDVLPFELPPTFSNRHFYEFLLENEINLKGNKLSWKEDDESLIEIIKLLFDLKDLDLIQNQTTNEITIEPNQLNRALKTIPFGYKISHKEKEFRELSLIHPKNQLTFS